MDLQTQSDVVILVAEDDIGHFLLTKRYIRNAGIDNKIVHLQDGQITLDYLKNNCSSSCSEEEKRHVLLLDIRMPKIDGIEILEQIRNDSGLKDIPVMVVTTSDNPASITRCQELGCESYLVKPLAKSFAESLIKLFNKSFPR